jgi:hypothetical protein
MADGGAYDAPNFMKKTSFRGVSPYEKADDFKVS